MLLSKQRSYLRKLANDMEPILQVGKGGISENLIKQVDDALEARELIKITVLNNSFDDPKDICEELVKSTGSHGVQVVGKKIVLYRESKENKKIILPKP